MRALRVAALCGERRCESLVKSLRELTSWGVWSNQKMQQRLFTDEWLHHTGALVPSEKNPKIASRDIICPGCPSHECNISQRVQVNLIKFGTPVSKMSQAEQN